MPTLEAKLSQPDAFLIGVELVSTRGTTADVSAVKAMKFGSDLAQCDRIDWVSITDNAGGNPMLAPASLGKPIMDAGKEVVIHLSCKDFNRNSIESQAWQLASEGFKNILTLTGDFPEDGIEGMAKPVFDTDSVGLLTMLSDMNSGLTIPKGSSGKTIQLGGTEFYPGAVVTNFKLHENEVIPQYLKLEKKIECGAKFIINQIGYDSRKNHELIAYFQRKNLKHIPLVGNVYVLTGTVAKIFRSQKIPGVVISDELLELSLEKAATPDKGKSFFYELAAKQIAIYKGLGYKAAYLGGVHTLKGIERILDIYNSFGENDWKEFAKEILFSRPGEFFLLDEDPETKLANPEKLNPVYEASLKDPEATSNVNFSFHLSRVFHDVMFNTGKGLAKIGAKLCKNSADSYQGPKWLRTIEHASKSLMFECKDCGDCSLPETAFLCPESQCAKNQRNGPCGGTRDGKCEVHDFECIWAIAYDRMKYIGKDSALLDHSPVIQDQRLRGTSSWANSWLERDHIAKPIQKKTKTSNL